MATTIAPPAGIRRISCGPMPPDGTSPRRVQVAVSQKPRIPALSAAPCSEVTSRLPLSRNRPWPLNCRSSGGVSRRMTVPVPQSMASRQGGFMGRWGEGVSASLHDVASRPVGEGVFGQVTGSHGEQP